MTDKEIIKALECCCDKLVSKYAVELFEIDNLVDEMVGEQG